MLFRSRLCLDEESENVIEAIGQSNVMDCINKSDAKLAAELITGPLSKYIPTTLMPAIFADTPTLDVYQTWGLN